MTYYFTSRDAFRTPTVYRTDLSINFAGKIGPVEVFVMPQVFNVFNGHAITFVNNATGINTSVTTGKTTTPNSPVSSASTPSPTNQFSARQPTRPPSARPWEQTGRKARRSASRLPAPARPRRSRFPVSTCSPSGQGSSPLRGIFFMPWPSGQGIFFVDRGLTLSSCAPWGSLRPVSRLSSAGSFCFSQSRRAGGRSVPTSARDSRGPGHPDLGRHAPLGPPPDVRIRQDRHTGPRWTPKRRHPLREGLLPHPSHPSLPRLSLHGSEPVSTASSTTRATASIRPRPPWPSCCRRPAMRPEGRSRRSS